MIDFPDKKYNIIYADPAWAFDNKRTGGSLKSGAAQQYEVMELDDICNLPVGEIADSNCALIMWWVASMPGAAIKVVKSWGFELKTMTGFTWIKKTRNWRDFFGLGFWTRQQAENALIAIKGRPEKYCRSVRQLIRAVNEKHSKKPDETRDRIVELFGDLPRIELFARQRVLCWDCWGNEINPVEDEADATKLPGS